MAVLVLWAALVSAVFLRLGLVASVVAFAALLVVFVGAALLHRTIALRRGVPGLAVWDNVCAREFELLHAPEDVHRRIRESLEVLPHSRVRTAPGAAEWSTTVYGQMGSSMSRIRVKLATDDDTTSMRVTSRSVFPVPLDWGANWLYVNRFVHGLAERDVSMVEPASHSPGRS
jgi:hypothetical protein